MAEGQQLSLSANSTPETHSLASCINYAFKILIAFETSECLPL